MRLELQIPDDLVEDLKRYKPRTMSLPMFCAYLVELGVDRDVTLAERPTGSVASTSSNISNTISSSSLNISSSDNNNTVVKLTKKSGKTGKSRKRPEYSEDFNALWKLYQSAPDRVSSQTKPKAFDE